MSAIVAPRGRERFIVSTGLLGLALLAWVYLFLDARRMNAGSTAADCMRQMSAFSSITALPPLWLMWSIMMVAMMLPSALPMVLTFAAVSRNRRQRGRPYVPVAIFIGGYLLVWFVFSVLAAVAQWVLHRAALLSDLMASRSTLLAGLLLLGAGLFQFTPLKHACLHRCRSTFEFIMTRWREGRLGALRMGLEHGAFCTGCCWALMSLLFVLGVMNLLWIAALTVIVCLEKLLRAGARSSVAIGFLLLGAGLYVLAQQL